LKSSVFHRLSDVLWVVIVSFIVLLAIYVSVGRMLASLTASYQVPILQELNHRVPFLIEARSVSAQWHSFNPVLVLEGVTVTLPGESGRPLALEGGRIDLDVAGSLRSWTLQMTRLSLTGLSLSGELDEHGQLRIKGFGGGDTALGEWAERFLANVEVVALEDVVLSLGMPGGERRGFDLDLELFRDGSRRWLEAHLSSTRGLQVLALAQGVGNPFDPDAFVGELYLDIRVPDAGALSEFSALAMPELVFAGSAELEVWSSWDQGEPSASIRFASTDLLVAAADESWRVPLDGVAFAASVLRQRNQLDLFLADLEIVRGGNRLQVPRMQLALSGETLMLRGLEVPVGPLAGIVGSMASLPEAATGVVAELAPAGTLAALELNVADINAPLQEWDLQAAFFGVSVQPWHGAPGVSGAGGYVSLAPGGGQVILDSRLFSMAFPAVYAQPLLYDDFHGTINIAWDETAVVLSSGLVEAVAEEGPVRVLFGLSIPLQETLAGIEMDLMVGLDGARADHRGKYIPFILDEGLRQWLSQGIGEGEINHGGFIWRGSLQHSAAALHTVQLYFDVSDAQLSYHPDWPMLTAVDATVLINDVNVSVWADSATLYSSRADDLAVEVWKSPDGQLRLTVDASLEGPAADGLAIVNNSPVGGMAGDAFAGWLLDGELATELKLALDLDDATAAEIELSAQFDSVDLEIIPGHLPLRDISGTLVYSSEAGFSSDELAGSLWGRPVSGRVSQREAQPAASARAPIPAAVIVDLLATVETGDLASWLGQDTFTFASGQAPVSAQVVVAEGEPPRVRFHSSLEGVGLELPAPWGKPPAPPGDLQLEMAFIGGDTQIDLTLGDELAARLALSDSGLKALAVAAGAAVPELEPGKLLVRGHLPRVDLDQWIAMLVSENDLAGAQELPLEVFVDKLEVGQLVANGRELGALNLSLAGQGERWNIGLETDWLQAQWLPPGSGGPSRLDIGLLDLAGIDALESALAGRDSQQVLEVPDVAVTVQDLRRGGQRLGRLEFELRSEGPLLLARNITGAVAGLELESASPGHYSWVQGQDARSEFSGSLSFADLGKTLEQFGYEEILETQSGRLDMALEWPGGPQDFSLAALAGSINVDIGQGNFAAVSAGASGTLRVVSILNLAEIVQRLSLTHMFESGVPFNTIEGQVFFHNGTIEVAALNVQGGASSFQFSGVSEVVSRSLNGDLVVTLPVANNLAWVAALTAGLPVAAGVFVLSKLFETQVNRLTSLMYSTTGTWDEPRVQFERVFDDSSSAADRGNAGATQSSSP
jgi:uncharacterized protein (TIGR02099 family)